MANSVIVGFPLVSNITYLDSSGALVDPTSPRVDLLDPNSNLVVAQATPARTGLGLYAFTYQVPLNALLGNWTVSATGVINGQYRGPLTETWVVNPVGQLQFQPSQSYTYDLTTPRGQVRLLTDDRDMSQVSTTLPLEARSAIFSDAEIDVFLANAGNDVFFASADALITISGNRSLLVTSRRIGRETVDYSAVRADLRAQAAALIEFAMMQPADGLAEIAWTDPALRRIIINTQLRQGI